MQLVRWWQRRWIPRLKSIAREEGYHDGVDGHVWVTKMNLQAGRPRWVELEKDGLRQIYPMQWKLVMCWVAQWHYDDSRSWDWWCDDTKQPIKYWNNHIKTKIDYSLFLQFFFLFISSLIFCIFLVSSFLVFLSSFFFSNAFILFLHLSSISFADFFSYIFLPVSMFHSLLFWWSSISHLSPPPPTFFIYHTLQIHWATDQEIDL